MSELTPAGEAFQTLKELMHADPEYAWAWHCNLAMPFIDSGCDDAVAQEGAARVMQSFFGVDTRLNPSFKFARGVASAGADHG